MNSGELLALSDLNLAESTREMARWQRDYRVEERDDLLFVAGADPFPIGFANCVMALGPRAPADAEHAIALADRHFGSLGRGYTLWTRDHLDAALALRAEQAGLAALSDTPGMVLREPSSEGRLDAGLRVAQVVDVESASGLAAVEAGGYATVGMPEEITARIFAMPERLLTPHTVVVLGYLEEKPVAAAIAILSHGIAGLYWVATRPEARGRGLGEACTRLAGNRAFELGARCVVLQASKQGEPIYRRMGYGEITRYRWYVKGPPAPGA